MNVCWVSIVFDSFPDRYKTPEIYDKAVDLCLPALKFVADCFVTNISKCLKSLTMLHSLIMI